MEALLLIIFVSVAAIALFIAGVRVRERGYQMRQAEKAPESARSYSLDALESKQASKPTNDADKKHIGYANWPDWQFLLTSRF